MKAIRYLLGCTLVLLLGSSLQASAEDIDIYSGGANLGTPNVLIVLDNSASLDASAGTCTYADGGAPSGTNLFALEFCSLYNVIYALPVNSDGTARVNIGLMGFNGANVVGYGNGGTKGCQASSNNGGCLVQKIVPMTAANKGAWMTWIRGLAESSIKSNNEADATAMWEAWAYYAGKNNSSGTTLVPSGLDYSSIQPQASCQKNFVVFIGNAANSVTTPGDPSTPSVSGGLASAYATQVAPAPTTPPAGVIVIPSGNYGLNPVSVAANQCTTSGATYTMPINHSDGSGLYADEWARFMYGTDVYSSTSGTQNITTYTIGVLGPNGCHPDMPALLASMANFGGGKFYPVSAGASSDLTNALLTILNEVQAVNSVFASSSLPVSVNAQGSYLNQIYMGMFRPDPKGAPRWAGNLKQYQFIVNSTGNLQLGDAAGQAAISSSTGFLAPAAASFWTCTSSANPLYTLSPYSTIPITSGTPTCPAANAMPPSSADPTVGFWANNALYTSATYGGKAYDLSDGELVDKGGAAQQLRLASLIATYPTNTTPSGNSPRKMYTYCPSSSNCISSLTDPSNVFDVSNPNITDLMLGTGSRNITYIATLPVTPTSSPVSLVNAVFTGTPITITAAATTTNMVTNWPAGFSTTYTAGVIDTASAADVAKIGPVGTLASVYYGGNPAVTCYVVVLTSTTFGYPTAPSTYCQTSTSSWNVQPSPIGPQVAGVYSSSTSPVVFTTNAAHSLIPGQQVAVSGCKVLTALNGTLGTVQTLPTANSFSASFAVGLWPPATDTSCSYTPNTATVTSAGHNFPQGSQVTISGSSVAAYNGNNWYINVIDANTFSFAYTAAPTQGTATSATVTSNTTRTQLINWVRGQDNVGDEQSLCPPGVMAGKGNCPKPAVTARPSMHGDVLHSRPSVVDYGGSIGVVAFYGSNDGAYHAVDGNQPTFIDSSSGTPVTLSDPNAGQELWSFIPARYYNRLMRLRANVPVVQMPSTPLGYNPAPQRKDYFFDGSTSVYQLVKSDGTAKQVYIYLTARRGSRALWAMDVTTPTSPNLLWKIDNTTNSSGAASTQFAELGQTWSSPRLVPVSGWPNPVLIFGAGYDPAEDVDPPQTDTMGRGIFIVDAVTGQLVWSASPTGTTGCTGSGTSLQCHVAVPNMTYSIPSDITMMDIDGDGQIDRLYAADVGGNVWRVDLEPKAITANAWQIEQIAALGCATGACPAGTSPRKFLFNPDVIRTQNFTAVFVGSGNRENPLTPPASVNNRLYMLKDTATGPDGSALPIITEQTGTAYNLDDCTGTTANPNTCSTLTTGATNPTSYGLLSTAQQKSGYYVTLNSLEQCVNAPVAFGGYVYFGTNQPTPPSVNQCTGTLGTARGYQLSAFGGNYSSIIYTGGGLPPTPVAGLVTVGGKQYPFLIGGADPTCLTADCKSAFGGHQVKINVPSNRYRTYRYQEGK